MRRADDIEFRSGCPIASTLDLVGDRWSLVLLRDLVNGKRRFAEFLDSPERITTNVLTERLARLDAHGLIARRPYQTRPKRYEHVLTAKGAALLPILQDICRWADEHLPNRWKAPASFMSKMPKDLA